MPYLFSVQTINSSNVAASSQLINLTFFGLAIPAGATIDAVSFDIVAGWGSPFAFTETTYADADLIPARNCSARLLIAGAAVGSNKQAGELPRAYTTKTYGGNAGYWGATLPTQAQLNATGFGVQVQYDAFVRSGAFGSTLGPVTLFVQSASVTVQYTLGGSTIAVTRQWDPETSLRHPGVGTSGKIAAYRFTVGGVAWKGARMRSDLETGFLYGRLVQSGNADRFFFGLDAGTGVEFDPVTMIPLNTSPGAFGVAVVAGVATAYIWNGTTLNSLTLGTVGAEGASIGVRYVGQNQPIEFFFKDRKVIIPTLNTPPFSAKLGPVLAVGASSSGSGFVDAKALSFGKNLSTVGG
jgi:hypothetical protein